MIMFNLNMINNGRLVEQLDLYHQHGILHANIVASSLNDLIGRGHITNTCRLLLCVTLSSEMMIRYVNYGHGSQISTIVHPRMICGTSYTPL